MSFPLSISRPGWLRFGEGGESWVWPKETPELLAPMVSRRCAIKSFPNIERVGDDTAYDAVRKGNIREVAAALYERLRSERLGYAGAAYLDDGRHSQQVRNPADIHAEQRATCLDISLLYAALALDLDLQPIIVLLDGAESHALVVLRTTSTTTFDRHTKGKTIVEQVERGRLLAVEVTGATIGEDLDLDFDAAERMGRERVGGWDFVAAVDPERLHRQRGFRTYTCEEPAGRVWFPLALLALGMAGLAAWLLGPFGSDGPTRFGNTITGVALLPAAQDEATNQLTAEFDARLSTVMAGDSRVPGGQVDTGIDGDGSDAEPIWDGKTGRLIGYPLAGGLEQRALTVPVGPERDAAVDKIIADTNASLVLAPRLAWETGEVKVEVDAWLGHLDGAEELAGERLGFLLCDRPPSIDMLRMGQDSELLLEGLAVGLVSTQFARLELLLEAIAAQRRFRYPEALNKLNDVLGETSTDGCTADGEAALIYHLRGNTRLDLGDYEGAEDDYTTALGLDQHFSRSQLGLAEVDLLDAVARGCRPDTVNSIRSAARAYKMVSSDLDSGEDAALAIKRDIGLARVLVCSGRAEAGLGQSPADTFDAATDLLDAALAGFEELKAADDPATWLLNETAAVGYLERADVRLRMHRQGDDPQAARLAIEEDHDRARDSTIRRWVHASIAHHAFLACQEFDDECDSRLVEACSLIDKARLSLSGSESAALVSLADQSDELDCQTG